MHFRRRLSVVGESLDPMQFRFHIRGVHGSHSLPPVHQPTPLEMPSRRCSSLPRPLCNQVDARPTTTPMPMARFAGRSFRSNARRPEWARPSTGRVAGWGGVVAGRPRRAAGPSASARSVSGRHRGRSRLESGASASEPVTGGSAGGRGGAGGPGRRAGRAGAAPRSAAGRAPEDPVRRAPGSSVSRSDSEIRLRAGSTSITLTRTTCPELDHLPRVADEGVGHRRDVHQPVLVHPDVDEGPECRDVGDDALQHHPRPQVADLLDAVGEGGGGERRARVTAGLLQLGEDVGDGGHAEGVVDEALRASGSAAARRCRSRRRCALPVAARIRRTTG